ncbi:MAG TPA: hypothetical protein VGC56_15250 [Allosphingosinicella sp.]|jgi:hypothetical protein
MKTLFQTKDRRTVEIEVDEFDWTVRVRTVTGGDEIGRMSFEEHECADGRSSALYLTWCFLDRIPGWTGVGIGRECLRLAGEVSASPITAAADDGMKREDGSHLTGDAPGFVQRMREEGLIIGRSRERDPDED